MSTIKALSLLIVDDDPVIRKIHKMLVSKLGFQVNTQEATNGKEAIDLYYLGESFDIVFMDLEMPIMDGFEATKELRKMGVKSMIVGVTSRTNDDEKEAFMAAGLDDCYGKPLTIDKMNSLLEKLEKAS